MRGRWSVGEAAQTSAMATVPACRQADIAALGMNPLLSSFIYFTIAGPVVGGLMWALLSTGIHVGLLVLVFIPWFLVVAWLGIALVIFTVTWGGIGYRHTRNAVQSGRIGVTYCLRDSKGVNFVVVDEDRRLVCVSGTVFKFSDVREIAWEMGNKKNVIQFTLTSGANPVCRADLGSETALKAGYARVGNSLDII